MPHEFGPFLSLNQVADTEELVEVAQVGLHRDQAEEELVRNLLIGRGIAAAIEDERPAERDEDSPLGVRQLRRREARVGRAGGFRGFAGSRLERDLGRSDFDQIVVSKRLRLPTNLWLTNVPLVDSPSSLITQASPTYSISA